MIEERQQEFIEIRGARENNLKEVSLRIPKRKITIFTGVSGSGKSSLVFDTIASEAQRQLYENFSMFVRNFLPRYAQPDVDSIANLSMPVLVDQRRLGGGAHSTVGTITDIYTLLRLLFSKFGRPHVGHYSLFSFNDPQGMCPECNGLGRKLGVDLERFLDTTKSLNEGAILFEPYAVGSWDWGFLTQSGLFDNDKKLDDYDGEELERMLYGPPQKIKVDFGGKSVNITFEGIVDKFARKYIARDLSSYSERTQKQVQPYITTGPCRACKGARLNQAALGSKIRGLNIAEMAAMEVGELVGALAEIEEPAAQSLVQILGERLQHLVDIGLEYLSLERATGTLSGGESQRVKIVKQLSSSLNDVMVIFDEPSIGLHAHDVHRLNALLRKLRDKGNTVLVVEHDPDVVQAADHIVDMGPRAGAHGGEIVYEGSFEGLLQADTVTGRTLQEATPLKEHVRAPRGALAIKNARLNNLQNLNVEIPTSVLTVVTGVAGSGKSSLIHGTLLRQHPDAIVIDQSEVAANRRSTPATYTGIMDEIRNAFARANKVSKSLFSFNSQGACENCNGLGVVYISMDFLDEARTSCDVCGGKRFKDEVLGYTLQGQTISDVLSMPVEEALRFFGGQKKVAPVLQAMSDVGLDYLSLGQPLSTLSGGECRRIKLASELHKEGAVYVMDEPTTGLHRSDIGRLLAVIDRIVDNGNTVVVVEHNLDVIKNADWIVDLGPEGGHKGGRILFEGPPCALLAVEGSYTADYLRREVQGVTA